MEKDPSVEDLSDVALEKELFCLEVLVQNIPFMKELPELAIQTSDIVGKTLSDGAIITLHDFMMIVFFRFQWLGIQTYCGISTLLTQGFFPINVDIVRLRAHLSLVRSEKERRLGNLSKQFYRFENETFFINLNDGSVKSINFSSKRGNKNMLLFFAVFFEYWKNYAKPQNDWLEVTLSNFQIRTFLEEKGLKPEKITDQWIKDTKGNIMESKVKATRLENFIQIHKDSKSLDYVFALRRAAS